MKEVRCLVPFAFFVLACDSTPPEPPNTPPEAVGTIADQQMRLGDRFEVSNIGQYFTDADGDELTYDAEATGDAGVTVEMSGSAVVGYSTDIRGTDTVTVIAMDPDSTSAEQKFNITVGNRAPVGDTIPDMLVPTDTQVSLDASRYFSDPDGDDLMYEGTSEDVDLVAVTVDGDIVLLSVGSQKGYVGVTITAMDQHGNSAGQRFVVGVYERGTGFRDDFESSSSLKDWLEHEVRARVIDSMVVLDNGEDNDVPYRSHIYREVDLSGGWHLLFAVGLNNDKGPWAGALVATGDPRFPWWTVAYSWLPRIWEVQVFDTDIGNGPGDWRRFGVGVARVNNSEQSMWEWRLSANSIMTLRVEGQELFAADLSGRYGGPPLDVIGVGLGFYSWDVDLDDDDGGTFDFVEIRD